MSSTSRRHYSNNNDLEAGGSQIGESERLIGPDVIEMQPLISRISRVKAHDRGTEAEKIFRRAEEERANGTLEESPSPPPSGDFTIGRDKLAVLSRDHNVAALLECGGVKGLSDSLKTNLEEGIKGDNDDLLKRKYEFGPNIYPWKKGRSFWMFLWDAWQNPTLIILIVVAVASLALGIKTQNLTDRILEGKMISLGRVGTVGVRRKIIFGKGKYWDAWGHWTTDKVITTHQCGFWKSRSVRDGFVTYFAFVVQDGSRVIRSGRRIEISIYDIVVGDVVPLNIGDRIPANGVLITGHSLAIDESSMTRERKIVHKDSRDPFLFSGFKVADGSGTMLVTSVGINADWGNHRANISEDTVEETPLQGRLNGLATLISKVEEYTVAVCVLIVLLVRYFTGNSKDANENVLFIAGTTKVGPAIDGAIQIVNVAVTIVLVAVPKGLPLAVPLTLAYAMRKMMADKALVRRLSACETIGSATTICSEKTGTLTLNQMDVVEAYVGGEKIDPSKNKLDVSSELRSLLIEGIAQNTNGSVYAPEGGGDVKVSGSPTEKAILNWGMKLGMKFEDIRSKSSVLHVFPFNSEKKQGGIALKLSNSQVRIHWKGAAEIVLASCTHYRDAANKSVAMVEDKAEFFKKAIEEMAASSLRCVAIAYRSYDMEKVPSTEQELAQWALPEDDLVLLAIMGIKDPCRPGVKDAVQLCKEAKIQVRMVTGDNLQTAKAIALECGILDPDKDSTEPTLIEGRVFRLKTDLEREEIVDQIFVMGRSSPSDKLLLVQALKRKGHVVAVTGDGANDAPALHEADIGLAMGISGTEVAKESSDIVILDDDFASVVKVVRWGQSVYANIQKFIQFHLTVNVAALIINVVAAVSSGDVPLNAVQLLWVNLIMDTLGPLALATEPPTDRQMHRPPFGQSESPIITNIMLRNSLIQALYQVTLLLVLSFQGRSLLNLEGDTISHALKVKNTLIFNSFVLLQIFNEFNARKPNEFNVFKGITKNYLFMGIVGVTVVLQVIIIEFLGKFTSTVRLNRSNWLISVIIGFLSWPLAVLGKLIPVPKTPIGDILARFYQRGASRSSLYRRRE
nr:calcium-transporting ATPase 8, plasma membrane-type-like [Quercus suber]